jgi:hypothetical protein
LLWAAAPQSQLVAPQHRELQCRSVAGTRAVAPQQHELQRHNTVVVNANPKTWPEPELRATDGDTFRYENLPKNAGASWVLSCLPVFSRHSYTHPHYNRLSHALGHS